MTVSLRRRSSLAAIVLVISLWPTVAAAECRIALGGDGNKLTVALRGTPGHALEVDWGDGTTSSTRRTLKKAGGRVHLRHTYSGTGRYEVRARAAGGAEGDCQMRLSVRVPYPEPDDDDSRGVLPPVEAPDTSDLVGEDEAVGSLLEVTPRAQSTPAESPPRSPGGRDESGIPGVVERPELPAPIAPPSPIQSGIEAISQVLWDVFGGLFGRRR